MPRLFIACPIVPPPPVRKVLRRLTDLRPTLRPVHPDQLHLTLCFLGDLPEERALPIASAMDRALATLRGGRAGGDLSCRLHFHGLGRFPSVSRRAPRVLFADPTGGEPLAELSAALRQQLAELDPPVYPADDKPFTAHLTLARVKVIPRRPSPATLAVLEQVEQMLSEMAACDLGVCRVEAIELVESLLTAEGPLHEVRYRLGLATP
jgi:2'-5' RNA ligase